MLDTKGGRELSWPGTKISVFERRRPIMAHFIQSTERGKSTDQNRLSCSLGATDDVGTKVHPVDQVDVKPARRSEHDLCTGCRAAKGVRRGIVLGVCLDLDDLTRPAATMKLCTEQKRRNLDRRALEQLF